MPIATIDEFIVGLLVFCVVWVAWLYLRVGQS